MRTRSALALMTLLSACAGGPPPAPAKIERISAEALAAALPPADAATSLEDVVAWSRAGRQPGEIIGELKKRHLRHRLTARQILDLAGRGVAPEVLDHLLAAERQAVFDDLAGEMAKREQALREAADQELSLCRMQCFNGWYGPAFGGCWPPRPGEPYWRCF